MTETKEQLPRFTAAEQMKLERINAIYDVLYPSIRDQLKGLLFVVAVVSIWLLACVYL